MKSANNLTIVIKLGTSSIVDEKSHEPLLSILSLIVETTVKLRQYGHRVVLVSSGAIGVGLKRMNENKRPKHLPRIQALAAVGQCRLISLWDSLFAHLQQPVAQILLTRNDIADRTQYLNAQNTISELLNMGVIPIVNENDTIAVSEIKFGDNDTLSAITAAMVQADFLFLMTDVDCLYTANPRTHKDAKPIEVITNVSHISADVSTPGSNLGTGGMSSKIVAARLATSAGVTTVITRSSKPGNVVEIINYIQALEQSDFASKQSGASTDLGTASGETSLIGSSALIPPLHTRFLPSPEPIRDRSFWLLHGLAPRGTIYIDEGAHRAVAMKAGLLPVGVVDVEGNFAQQEAVRLVLIRQQSHNQPMKPKQCASPTEIGRALVNYSAMEIVRIKGLQSSEIEGVLGYADSEYVALRENISLVRDGNGQDGIVTSAGTEIIL